MTKADRIAIDEIPKFIISLLLLILIIASLSLYSLWKAEEERSAEVQQVWQEIERTQQMIDETEAILDDCAEFMDKLKVEVFEVSAYAPLDPAAVKGMCHDGNPTSTATGTYPTAGRTIAVDPRIISLGSKVLINGNVYVAEDVGGAIKGNRIDMVMATQKEALAWGKQSVRVIWGL